MRSSITLGHHGKLGMKTLVVLKLNDNILVDMAF